MQLPESRELTASVSSLSSVLSSRVALLTAATLVLALLPWKTLLRLCPPVGQSGLPRRSLERPSVALSFTTKITILRVSLLLHKIFKVCPPVAELQVPKRRLETVSQLGKLTPVLHFGLHHWRATQKRSFLTYISLTTHNSQLIRNSQSFFASNHREISIELKEKLL